MTDRAVYVYVDLDGKPVLVGTLHARFRKNRESATLAFHCHPIRRRARIGAL